MYHSRGNWPEQVCLEGVIGRRARHDNAESPWLGALRKTLLALLAIFRPNSNLPGEFDKFRPDLLAWLLVLGTRDSHSRQLHAFAHENAGELDQRGVFAMTYKNC